MARSQAPSMNDQQTRASSSPPVEHVEQNNERSPGNCRPASKLNLIIQTCLHCRTDDSTAKNQSKIRAACDWRARRNACAGTLIVHWTYTCMFTTHFTITPATTSTQPCFVSACQALFLAHKPLVGRTPRITDWTLQPLVRPFTSRHTTQQQSQTTSAFAALCTRAILELHRHTGS